MYRLGRRYEAGLGAWHNKAEAHRCYLKAAKLGNSSAIQRLEGRQAAIDAKGSETPGEA